MTSERILEEDDEKPTGEQLKSMSEEVGNTAPILMAVSNAEDAEELPTAIQEEEAVMSVEEDHKERPEAQMDEI
jgi:hypothetical protein